MLKSLQFLLSLSAPTDELVFLDFLDKSDTVTVRWAANAKLASQSLTAQRSFFQSRKRFRLSVWINYTINARQMYFQSLGVRYGSLQASH